MKLGDFELLSFDCYGTLIDWETGLLDALAPLIRATGKELDPDRILELFARLEFAQQQREPGMLYSRVLEEVHRQMAGSWNAQVPDEIHRTFGGSVSAWPPFADTVAALAYLKSHYRLVILSNVDRRSFAATNRRLEVEFDAIYTAEDIGSYKPDPRNFYYLIEHVQQDFGVPREKLLHVAQSLLHDHEPAKQLGLATAWIDRRHGKGGGGATAPSRTEARYDFRFRSLAELAEAHRAASS